MDVSLDMDGFDAVKKSLAFLLPNVKSSHRVEAMARGLGFSTNAALRASLATGPVSRSINDGAFLDYLADHGFTTADKPLLQAFLLAVPHCLKGRDAEEMMMASLAWGIADAGYHEDCDTVSHIMMPMYEFAQPGCGPQFMANVFFRREPDTAVWFTDDKERARRIHSCDLSELRLAAKYYARDWMVDYVLDYHGMVECMGRAASPVDPVAHCGTKSLILYSNLAVLTDDADPLWQGMHYVELDEDAARRVREAVEVFPERHPKRVTAALRALGMDEDAPITGLNFSRAAEEYAPRLG